MPLKPGYSKKVIKENTEREIQAGKPPKQAYAIAMREAKRHAAVKGKKVKGC